MPAEIFAQRFRELHCVGALLKANDHTVTHRPDVREAGFERFAGRFRARRIKAQADDAVTCFKNLRGFGVPIFKIAEQTREKINDAVQLLIDATFGENLRLLPSARLVRAGF